MAASYQFLFFSFKAHYILGLNSKELILLILKIMRKNAAFEITRQEIGDVPLLGRRTDEDGLVVCLLSVVRHGSFWSRWQPESQDVFILMFWGWIESL